MATVDFKKTYIRPSVELKKWTREQCVAFCKAHVGFSDKVSEEGPDFGTPKSAKQMRNEIHLSDLTGGAQGKPLCDPLIILHLVDCVCALAAATHVRVVTDEAADHIDRCAKMFLDAEIAFEAADPGPARAHSERPNWLVRTNYAQVLLLARQARKFGTNLSPHMNDLGFEREIQDVKPE
jgi:hypothetical protein